MGHLGWAYDGVSEFESRVGSFLAEGDARRERLILVADDPKVSLWPKELLDRGVLVLLSTSEVYGTDRIVDAPSQRATFEATLAEALSLGFTGMRVVADNTSLIAGPDRLGAWMRWEDEADRLMRASPITGLCAFDRTRCDPETLRSCMEVHDAGPPPLRMGPLPETAAQSAARRGAHRHEP